MQQFKHFIENVTKFDLTLLCYLATLNQNSFLHIVWTIIGHNYGIMVLDIQKRFMLLGEK